MAMTKSATSSRIGVFLCAFNMCAFKVRLAAWPGYRRIPWGIEKYFAMARATRQCHFLCVPIRESGHFPSFQAPRPTLSTRGDIHAWDVRFHDRYADIFLHLKLTYDWCLWWRNTSNIEVKVGAWIRFVTIFRYANDASNNVEGVAVCICQDFIVIIIRCRKYASSYLCRRAVQWALGFRGRLLIRHFWCDWGCSREWKVCLRRFYII